MRCCWTSTLIFNPLLDSTGGSFILHSLHVRLPRQTCNWLAALHLSEHRDWQPGHVCSHSLSPPRLGCFFVFFSCLFSCRNLVVKWKQSWLPACGCWKWVAVVWVEMLSNEVWRGEPWYISPPLLFTSSACFCSSEEKWSKMDWSTLSSFKVIDHIKA